MDRRRSRCIEAVQPKSRAEVVWSFWSFPRELERANVVPALVGGQGLGVGLE